MANYTYTIESNYVGDGTTVLYSITFPYIDRDDVFVSIDKVITTEYIFNSSTAIQFTTAPANGAAIRIYRNTSASELKANFFPGSSIRADDLNDNFTQSLYVVQENVFATGNSTNIALEALSVANDALEYVESLERPEFQEIKDFEGTSPSDGDAVVYNAATDKFEYGPAGILEAPVDGQQYARKEAGWVVVEAGTSGLSEDFSVLPNLPSSGG